MYLMFIFLLDKKKQKNKKPNLIRPKFSLNFKSFSGIT